MLTRQRALAVLVAALTEAMLIAVILSAPRPARAEIERATEAGFACCSRDSGDDSVTVWPVRRGS